MDMAGVRGGWTVARQPAAAPTSDGLHATGTSAVAFQGSNAHSILQQPVAEATLASLAKLDLWMRTRFWVTPRPHSGLSAGPNACYASHLPACLPACLRCACSLLAHVPAC